MIKGGYNFEEYSVVLPYKQGDDINTGVAANEARALRARSHMALVSQNDAWVDTVTTVQTVQIIRLQNVKIRGLDQIQPLTVT